MDRRFLISAVLAGLAFGGVLTVSTAFLPFAVVYPLYVAGPATSIELLVALIAAASALAGIAVASFIARPREELVVPASGAIASAVYIAAAIQLFASHPLDPNALAVSFGAAVGSLAVSGTSAAVAIVKS